MAVALSLLAAASALLLFSCTPKRVPPPQSIFGSWRGVISVQGRRLEVVTTFTPDGKATMVFVSSSRGDGDGIGKGFPVVHISYNPPRIDFALEAGSDLAYFHGRLEGNRIRGSFEQAGQKGTFEFTKSGGGADSGGSRGKQGGGLHRDPSAAGGALAAAMAGGGIRAILETKTGALHGSLLLPPGKPPFPVVLIISGSGSMDRNGNEARLHVTDSCLELLARALAKRGFASLRYDKRGVGASAAALPPGAHPTLEALTSDAALWIDNLKRDPRFRGVAVLGYGEGALVGMMAAREAGAEAFVSVAGPGEPEGSSVNPQVEIARLTVPVLIIQGMSDLRRSVSQAELLHRAAPRSDMDLIRGMNHVLRDVPSDREANMASYSNPKLPIDYELVNVTSEFLRLALKVPPP